MAAVSPAELREYVHELEARCEILSHALQVSRERVAVAERQVEAAERSAAAAWAVATVPIRRPSPP